MTSFRGFAHLSLASAANIAAAKDWLVQNKPLFKSATSYAIFNEDGSKAEYLGRVCHREIGSAIGSKRDVVATEVGWSRSPPVGPKKTKEDIEPFLHWLLTDTPYSEFVLNRDDFEFCRDHGLVVSTDVPAPIMQNLMILSRHFYEVPAQVFQKWKELTLLGYDKALCYSVVFNTTFSNDVGGRPQDVVQGYSGHRASTSFTLEALRRFKDGDVGPMFETFHGPVDDPRKFYRVTSNYVGGLKLFLSVEDGYSNDPYMSPATCPTIVKNLMADASFRDILSRHRHGGSDMYRPPNPFTLPRPGAVPPNQMTYGELFTVGLPYIHQQGLVQ